MKPLDLLDLRNDSKLMDTSFENKIYIPFDKVNPDILKTTSEGSIDISLLVIRPCIVLSEFPTTILTAASQIRLHKSV